MFPKQVFRSFLGVAVVLLGSISVSPAAPKNPDELLVVAPALFHPSLREFIQFKESIRPTRLVSLEKILQQGTGVDDPEKLKRYLYEQWKTRKIHYVLLVGDADVLPVRYMVLDRVTEPALNYAFYPSDLYYADLARRDGSFDDWNGNKESFHKDYFGEVHGEKNKSDPINFDRIDYHPEIAVGRWPVNSPEEVARVAAKTMKFEKDGANPQRAGYRKAALVSVGGWVDSRPFLDQLAKKMASGWSIEKRYYSDRRSAPAGPPPTEPELHKLLNEGLQLICHTGHGNDDCWEQCFFLKHLDRLQNADRLPIMVSIGCSTARFATLPPYEPYLDVNGNAHAGSDHKEVFTSPPPPPACYQSGRFNPPGLGEQLVRQGPNGAVAYIGCNTGSQPCALTLLEGFILSIQAQKHPTLGDAWSGAINHYHQAQRLESLTPTSDWYPPSIFFQGMKFMLFGDPSLPIPGPETGATDLSKMGH